jgi:hypothetical protein
MTLSIVRNRGNVSQENWKHFMQRAMGATSTRIILGFPQKVISNYANHMQIHQLTLVFKICLVKK